MKIQDRDRPTRPPGGVPAKTRTPTSSEQPQPRTNIPNPASTQILLKQTFNTNPASTQQTDHLLFKLKQILQILTDYSERTIA